MKIVNLFQESDVYTSNVYLLTGNLNSLEDKNTLIDVGRDSKILTRIDEASTGVGKKRIEQVILTHNHYDHASLLPTIKERYSPVVYAFSSNTELVDVALNGGEVLHIADKEFEVIHAPGHSTDSICLYCAEEKILFAGDTPLVIRTGGGIYEEEFIQVLAYIASKPISTIYFGHGAPLNHDCTNMVLRSLENAKNNSNLGG